MGRVNSPSVIAEQRSLINALAQSNQEYIRKFENLSLGIGGPSTGHVGDDVSHNRGKGTSKTPANSLTESSYHHFEEENTRDVASKELTITPWSWPATDGHARWSPATPPSTDMSAAVINAHVHTNIVLPPVQDRGIPTTNAPMGWDQKALSKQLEHYSMLIKNLLKEVDEAQYKISYNSRFRMKGGIAGLREAERRELEKLWGVTALRSAERRLDSLVEGFQELPRMNRFDRANESSHENKKREGKSLSRVAGPFPSSKRIKGLQDPPHMPSLVQEPAAKETTILGAPEDYSSSLDLDGRPMLVDRSDLSPEYNLPAEKYAWPSDSFSRERLPLPPRASEVVKNGMADVPIHGAQLRQDPRLRVTSTPRNKLEFSTMPPQGEVSPVKAPPNELEWPLDQVLAWLAANKFSTDWQKTFESLNICGAEFLALGRGLGTKDEIGMMHRAVFPRLARVCAESGTGWDPGKQRVEGKRLRRSIRKLSRDLEGPQAVVAARARRRKELPCDVRCLKIPTRLTEVSPNSPPASPQLRLGRPVSACQRCRSTKIKCDGKLPACTACEKAMQSAQCAPTYESISMSGEPSAAAPSHAYDDGDYSLAPPVDELEEPRRIRFQTHQDEGHCFPAGVAGPEDHSFVHSGGSESSRDGHQQVLHSAMAAVDPRDRRSKTRASASSTALSRRSAVTGAFEKPIISPQTVNLAALNQPPTLRDYREEPQLAHRSFTSFDSMSFRDRNPMLYSNTVSVLFRKEEPFQAESEQGDSESEDMEEVDLEKPFQVESEQGDSETEDMEEVDRLVSLWTTVKMP